MEAGVTFREGRETSLPRRLSKRYNAGAMTIRASPDSRFNPATTLPHKEPLFMDKDLSDRAAAIQERITQLRDSL